MKRLTILAALAMAVSACEAAPPPAVCTSSRDCSARGLVCDVADGLCVECLGDTDCLEADQRCRERACVEVVACTSSRQCPGLVCDPTRGHCVECLAPADCDEGLVCEDGECEMAPVACASDRHCSALGRVCDVGASVCVECVRDADCGAGRSCSPDRTCAAGATRDDAGAPLGDPDASVAAMPCGAPGTLETEACGTCGRRERFCSAAAVWEIGPCEEPRACGADVVIALDLTGSLRAAVTANVAHIADELVAPLLARGDVRIGVAWFADFGVAPYGTATDRPFAMVLAPSADAAAVRAAIAALPTGLSGGDLPEAGVEALHVLAGGAAHATSTTAPCPSGTRPGGCFRDATPAAVLVVTDATQHNAPSDALAGGALVSPYAADLGAPTWSDARVRMIAAQIDLFAIAQSGTGESAPEPQLARLTRDLGSTPAQHLVTWTAPSSGQPDWTTALRASRAQLEAHFGL